MIIDLEIAVSNDNVDRYFLRENTPYSLFGNNWSSSWSIETVTRYAIIMIRDYFNNA